MHSNAMQPANGACVAGAEVEKPAMSGAVARTWRKPQSENSLLDRDFSPPPLEVHWTSTLMHSFQSSALCRCSSMLQASSSCINSSTRATALSF